MQYHLGGYQVIKQMGLLATTTSPYVFTGEESAEALQLEGNYIYRYLHFHLWFFIRELCKKERASNRNWIVLPG